MAQTNAPTWSRWLEKADLAPEWQAPANRKAWEKERRQIRRELWQLLGHLPPRPPVDGIHVIENKARAVYRLYNQENNFQSIVYPGLGHKYLPEMWQKRLSAMDKNLKTP
jgi:hypothetical protein